MFVVPQLSIDQLRREGATALLEIIDQAREAGAVVVTGVPKLSELRQACLQAVYKFALLPEEVRKKYERSDVQYSIGWSNGVEEIENGVADKQKGSFYFNPTYDAKSEKYSDEMNPLHHKKARWPTEVPEMKQACLELTELITNVAFAVIEPFDQYLSRHVDGFEPGSVTKIVQTSTARKGRCLCYFPPTTSTSKWCGEHLDHCVLTGLVAATYFNHDGVQVPCPDPNCGLHVRDARGDVHRITFPQDALFFQFGESLQILSGGQLPATRHFVAPLNNAPGIHRITFALFFNPDVDVILTSPNDVDCGVENFRQGQSFGEFSLSRFQQAYQNG